MRSERAAPGDRFAQLDRGRGSFRVFDLERRVRQAEPLRQHALEASTRRVAVRARLDEHVCGKRREAAGHGPDVEIVHRLDPRDSLQRRADFAKLDVRQWHAQHVEVAQLDHLLR